MSKKQEIKLTETEKKYSAFNKELSIVNDRILKLEIVVNRLEMSAVNSKGSIAEIQDKLKYLNKKVNIIASFVVIAAIALIAFVVR